MRDLHRQLCSRGSPTDFIGITIDSERLNHGPLWMSFRPIKDFNYENIWELLFNAVQSPNDFTISNQLSINSAVVKGTTGRGRMRLTEDTVNKKSILRIKNDDSLCLLRVLAAAYAYAVRGQIRTGKLQEYWNLIRRSNGHIQKKAAEELMNLSYTRIPLEGCGVQ